MPVDLHFAVYCRSILLVWIKFCVTNSQTFTYFQSLMQITTLSPNQSRNPSLKETTVECRSCETFNRKIKIINKCWSIRGKVKRECFREKREQKSNIYKLYLQLCPFGMPYFFLSLTHKISAIWWVATSTILAALYSQYCTL